MVVIEARSQGRAEVKALGIGKVRRVVVLREDATRSRADGAGRDGVVFIELHGTGKQWIEANNRRADAKSRTDEAVGAGSSAAGLVSSTLGIGSPIISFDPLLTGTVQLDKDDTISTSAISPAPGGILAQNNYTADFAYTQGFHFGTTLTAGFNNNHVTTNSTFALLTPQLGSNFQFKLTQNLLQGFGDLPNTRFIRIAKNNREISDVAFRLQVITTIDQIENMYWDLVYAYENVRVQQESLT